MNQTVPVHQPNVKISEVNTKQYQKPKKVAVNEADKYNLNQDYDIYENQVGEGISSRTNRGSYSQTRHLGSPLGAVSRWPSFL